MTTCLPKWEKCFVVVNKEQRTGMVCYCFTVGESQSEYSENAENENENLAKTKIKDVEINTQKSPHITNAYESLELEKNSAAIQKDQESNSTNDEYKNLLNEFTTTLKLSEETFLDHTILVFKGNFSNQDVNIRILQQNTPQPKTCRQCAKQSFNREEYLEIVKSLSHPFISIPILTRSASTSVLTMYQQYKRSIKDIIESRENLRNGNDTDARFICLCLTDAVMYLHDQRIVHRNICPHNVYLCENGDLMLGNFEQSIYTSELGVYMTGQCGSLGYQSPEVVAQLGYNHTVDYWGIGCVAYEFLFGIMPYVDADVSRMLSKTVLNPDFAITRLGSRFNRLPKPTQEAFRDGYLNRYPHKRIGFKPHDAKQLRWFQPFRWDMVRNKEYESPLKKFIKSEPEMDSQLRGDYNSKAGNSGQKLKSLTPGRPSRWHQSPGSSCQLKESFRDKVLNQPGKEVDMQNMCNNIPEKYDPSKRKKQQSFSDKEDNKNEHQNQQHQRKIDILPFINSMFVKEKNCNEAQSLPHNIQGEQQVYHPWQQDQRSHKPLLTPMNHVQENKQNYQQTSNSQVVPVKQKNSVSQQYHQKQQLFSQQLLPDSGPYHSNKDSGQFHSNKASGQFHANKDSGQFHANKDSGQFHANKDSGQFHTNSHTTMSSSTAPPLPAHTQNAFHKTTSLKHRSPRPNSVEHHSDVDNRHGVNEGRQPYQCNAEQTNFNTSSGGYNLPPSQDKPSDSKFKEFVAMVEAQKKGSPMDKHQFSSSRKNRSNVSEVPSTDNNSVYENIKASDKIRGNTWNDGALSSEN